MENPFVNIHDFYVSNKAKPFFSKIEIAKFLGKSKVSDCITVINTAARNNTIKVVEAEVLVRVDGLGSIKSGKKEVIVNPLYTNLDLDNNA